MRYVELVIKIPDKCKELLDNPNAQIDWLDAEHIIDCVRNGTPLPKGHGRLIDTNEITAFGELECNGHNVESLDEFTTIIEADKGA